MPIPKNHQMLVGIKKLPEKIGSIYVPEESRKREEAFQCIVEVLAQGADCYKDMNERGCEVGDRIFISAYAGLECPTSNDKYKDYSLRMIYDRDAKGVAEEGDQPLKDFVLDLQSKL